jgi:glycosyltransferase involved in cell wall biosynthesis
MTARPSVTVVIPAFNEEAHLATTLASVARQTSQDIIEILVADGRSSDRTRDIAREFDRVTVIDNPERIQAAGLNRAVAVARGDVIVRVDGHCELAPDYVDRCVDALVGTGAAIVGGAMTPDVGAAASVTQRAIATAMASRMGAGPARFHVGGDAGWVDTVYLGAYRRAHAMAVGGYAQDVGVNEDAEFAIRMSRFGGVWFDPRIRSTYVPRGSVRAVSKQFYRYGRSRARTVLRHPTQLRARQLMAPALVIGLASPWRRAVAVTYAAVVLTRAAYEARSDGPAAPALAVTLPVMHLSWGVGFLRGVVWRPKSTVGGVDPQPRIDAR